MTHNPIKITVATVTYNAVNVIDRTLASVAEQDYPCVEHIIVDGNSHDGTMAAFQRYQEHNSRADVRHEVNAVSEPDKGIYDAMNKALGMATGDYIVFLNAGDVFHSPDVLSRIAACAGEKPAVIYGNTDIVDGTGHFMRHRRLAPPARLSWHSFVHGMLVCHQAFFARRDIAVHTPYNLRYRFSADYDWCIRVMRKAARRKLGIKNAGIIVADYLNEGMTTQNHRRSLMERFNVMARHYGIVIAAAMHIWFIVRAAIKK